MNERDNRLARMLRDEVKKARAHSRPKSKPKAKAKKRGKK